jgi:hypothetical protein
MTANIIAYAANKADGNSDILMKKLIYYSILRIFDRHENTKEALEIFKDMYEYDGMILAEEVFGRNILTIIKMIKNGYDWPDIYPRGR